MDNENVSNTCVLLVGPCHGTARNLHVFNRAIRIQERETSQLCPVCGVTQKTKVFSEAPSVSVSVILNPQLVSFFCLTSGVFRATRHFGNSTARQGCNLQHSCLLNEFVV